jgi:ABC-2 type transport system permease protein
MHKIRLIISREYFVRVKKKSFLLTTILTPLVIIIFYAVIIAITVDGVSMGEKKVHKIAVLDEANLFDNKIETNSKSLQFTFIKNETENTFLKKYVKEGFESFLFIPKDSILQSKGKFSIHSPSTTSMTIMENLEEAINLSIRNKQLIASGIDPNEFDRKLTNITLENTIDSKDGMKKSYNEVAYGVSMFCGFLIYLMMIIYGTQVMRGVTEEKTNRIAEVVISSVKPFQLMMGKIVGIGAVGLTQFAIWMILFFSMQSAIPVIFPELMHQLDNDSIKNNENVSLVANTIVGLSSLPLTKIISCFIFYFLGGFLTYASLFAAVGSVVSEDQQEAQQLVFPILMPILLGFAIMTQAVNDPNSPLVVFGSIFPLTSPIVMMGRITSDVPLWQMGLSMILLVATFVFFTWITGKIYRIGILMYGKKPSWKEMLKWAFAKG